MLKGKDSNNITSDRKGNDVIYVCNDNDILYDNEYNDTLYGEEGYDVLNEGAGNDYLYSGYFEKDMYVLMPATDRMQSTIWLPIGNKVKFWFSKTIK